ncbi:putative heme utilization radical SAM enzyme HutW [Rhodoplanes elegans]|uniref:Putative heme utilization radical SAM enzyme HutW n=2 Tax=Rhodoplanes elegans TaxID=29408 RepID=A0A327KJE1_9BRAD|nr:putative heme utilization radical SAM enzyme HutW [Rhodoplanes elegans]RAI35408.1 putative heme utilization radical SAM enzyme HutW [Rhodoplanes elegans]
MRDHPASAPQSLESFLVPPGRDALTEAFSGRSFAPPWRGSTAIDPAETEAVLARVFETPRDESALAYLHVPYCQSRCLFCGFFQNVWRPEAAEAYVDDIVAEVAARATTPLVASAPIAAVYIGGGTPTGLPAAGLARLVAGLRTHLPLAPDCEVTLEGRSYDFGLTKAVAAIGAGVNRISLGVQSFDTTIRRRLGRKLAEEELRAAIGELIALGRAKIVCDLIYGLPGQTDETWAHDLDTVAALGLDGVTLYALNIWGGGPLSRAIAAGKLPPASPIARQAKAYAAGVARLTAHGFRQVSQSHFVRSAAERNVYNAGIKRGMPCLAFGPGAGGQAHGVRWRNVIEIERRRALQAEGRAPVEGLSRMPARYAAQAAITAGLERGSVDLAAVDSLAPGFAAAAAPLVANWRDAGLVAPDSEGGSERLRTTTAGAFWITNLTSGLYAALDRAAQPSMSSKEPRMTDTALAAPAPSPDALAAQLAANPDGVLEVLARQHGVSTLAATRMLPAANCTFAPAEKFADVMGELTGWGTMLFIVHTPSIVLECAGTIPPGEFGRGYFNLHGDSPIGGHIKAERCTAIAFVRRPFMGRESCSIQFFDGDGEAMFKIFVRRLPDRSMDPEQVERFEALRAKLAG